MTDETFLTLEGEEAWLRLKQHLEWSDHFALGFIFTDHPRVIHIFRERLAKIYKARVTHLISPDLEQPSDLLTKLMPDLLHPTTLQQVLERPNWIDLSIYSGEDWAQARILFLIRLNEQRESLRKSLKNPLVLILPASERTRIRTLVPDIWAIRDFCIDTGAWVALAPDASLPPVKHPVTQFPFTDFETSLVNEWERLKKKKTLDRGFLLAADRAQKVSLRAGHLEMATRIAESQRRFVKKLLKRVGETPESLRDLSVSLDNVGNCLKALGRLEKAFESYSESLEIRRQLLKRVGETPESLRDLSVSLDKVGDCLIAIGNLTQAKQYLEDGWAIVHHLLGLFPEQFEYKTLAEHFQDRILAAESDPSES